MEPILYHTGDVVKIFGRPEMESSHDIVNLSYPDIAADVKVGDDILFDDGELDMKVMEVQGPMLVAEVQNEGTLGAHKSVNVPGEHIDLPALTAKDRRNIELAIELDIDFIAHSFVRNAADVKAVQDILDAHNSDIKIISKIENQEGVDNIDEIIDACYGIMIARGDLGIEVLYREDSWHPAPHHRQVREGPEASNRGYTDAPHHDQEPSSYPCRGNRYRQCYFLSHRRPDAFRRNGKR